MTAGLGERCLHNANLKIFMIFIHEKRENSLSSIRSLNISSLIQGKDNYFKLEAIEDLSEL